MKKLFKSIVLVGFVLIIFGTVCIIESNKIENETVEYTETDLVVIKEYIMDESNNIETKHDYDGNGIVNSRDYVMIKDRLKN